MRSFLACSVVCALLALSPEMAGATQTREAVVAVKAPGAAGVVFKTDLLLTNLGFGDASCTLTLLDPLNSAATQVSVPENEGVLAIQDVYDVLLPGAFGSAGLLVECATAVGVTSRTFVEDGIDGTDLRGQSIHGFGLDQQLTSTTPKRILGVSQNSTSRTNVTFINTGSSDVTVTTTRDVTGATADTLVAASSLVQVNRALLNLFGVSDSANESLRFTVATGGPIVAMGTVVDSGSEHFATLAAIAADGAAGPLVLPAFKDPTLATDLDLYNAGGSSATVTLTFSSGETGSIEIDPGATTVADVLGTLGVSLGTGALELTASGPILAQARYLLSGPNLVLAALPAQSDVATAVTQRLGAYPGVSSATTMVSSRGGAQGYLSMTPPPSPFPLPASVRSYSIVASQAATVDWTVASSVGGSVAEFTTDNSSGLISFLVSRRNQHDLMVTPFHISEVPRPLVQQTGYSCTPGTGVFTTLPDWPGLAWEWFADGASTGLTSQSIDATPGVSYHVQVTDPFFANPGRSRAATVTLPLFCGDFESGDLSGWS